MTALTPNGGADGGTCSGAGASRAGAASPVAVASAHTAAGHVCHGGAGSHGRCCPPLICCCAAASVHLAKHAGDCADDGLISTDVGLSAARPAPGEGCTAHSMARRLLHASTLPAQSAS
eukprot:361322-Chlamydomonas_euryale.AAC.7